MIKVVEAAATRVLRSRLPTSDSIRGRRKAMYRWRRDQYDNHRRYGEVKHRHRHGCFECQSVRLQSDKN